MALGTDFYGISGRLQINGAGEMQKLAAVLSDNGYKPDEIEKIFYKNVRRVCRNVIGEKEGGALTLDKKAPA